MWEFCSAPTRRKITAQNSNQSSLSQQVDESDLISLIPHFFEFITNGCKKIAAPRNMMPSVCLGKNSFPIVTSVLKLDMNTPFEIKLPVISASLYGQGRVLLFSQINLVSNKALRYEDTFKLLSNATKWITNGSVAMTPFYALQFDKNGSKIVTEAFKELGFLQIRVDFSQVTRISKLFLFQVP